MSFSSALYAHLSTYAGLTALVGTRIYPQPMPQNVTLPAVTYQRIDGVRDDAYTRAVGSTYVRVQLNAWAKTYLQADAIRTQLRTAMRAMATGGGLTVHDVRLGTDMDDYDPDTLTYWHWVDVQVLCGGDV
jgi:hypothetical protein